MRYYKQINENYIDSIGTGNGGVEITESEYNEILSIIQDKPPRTENTDYRLKTDLTWEEYEVEPLSQDLDDTEALNIILGGAE